MNTFLVGIVDPSEGLYGLFSEISDRIVAKGIARTNTFRSHFDCVIRHIELITDVYPFWWVKFNKDEIRVGNLFRDPHYIISSRLNLNPRSASQLQNIMMHNYSNESFSMEDEAELKIHSAFWNELIGLRLEEDGMSKL